MSSIWSVGFVSLSLVLTCVAQAADPPSAADKQAEQELIKRYRDWEKAVPAGKAADQFEYNASEDYTHIGTIAATMFDKSGSLANLKALLATSWTFDELQVRVYGDAAVVTSRWTLVNAKLKDVDVTGQYRATEVFVKRGGRWLTVASQATKVVEPTAP